MNLAGTIKRLKTGTYTATRRTPTARVNGVAQPPTSNAFKITANIQPSSGAQLQRLPEGLRTSETITIWTPTELHVQQRDRLPDLVEYNGKIFEVQHVKDWQENGNFFECVAVRVGTT
jgi:hypothetical protein